jgi:hypothetical protein
VRRRKMVKREFPEKVGVIKKTSLSKKQLVQKKTVL